MCENKTLDKYKQIKHLRAQHVFKHFNIKANTVETDNKLWRTGKYEKHNGLGNHQWLCLEERVPKVENLMTIFGPKITLVHRTVTVFSFILMLTMVTPFCR